MNIHTYNANGQIIHTTKPFENLKIGCLGDSITYGLGASDRSKTSYVSLLKNDFAEVNNYGIGGCRITKCPDRTDSLVERYSSLPDDLDVITVFGGANDMSYTVGGVSTTIPKGNADSTTITEFNGALNVLFKGLRSKYKDKNKEIICIVPYEHGFANEDLLEKNDLIVDRCKDWSIPCLDLRFSGMDGRDVDTQSYWFVDSGLHPNDNGYYRIHQRVLAFIKQIKGV